MIFNCDMRGRVESVPSSVPLGSIIEDVVIIAPHSCATILLKIKPPTQDYLPDIICTPVIRTDDNGKNIVVFRATLPKSITRVAGKAEYQIMQFDGSGDQIATTYIGSFNVSRGVLVEMPESAEDLEEYTLTQIYQVISNVSLVYNAIVAVENLIGYPTEELTTAKKTIIGAVNDLAADVAKHAAAIGEGNVINPPELATAESGLIGLANAVYRMLKDHFSETADSPYGGDPHNTRAAIKASVDAHNSDEDAHPSIQEDIDDNAELIAIDQYNIANLQAAVGKTDKLDTSAKNLAGAIIEVNDIAKKARDRANNNETRLISINAQLQGVGRSYAIEDFNDFVKFANGTYSVAVREDRNGDGYDETYYITASDLKTGDNVLLAELDVPDFWFEKTDKPSEKTYTYGGTEFSLNAYNGADLVGVFHILETDYQVIQSAAMSASKSAEDASESAKDAKGYRDDTQAIAESIYLKQVAPPLERLQTAIVLPSATLAQIGG